MSVPTECEYPGYTGERHPEVFDVRAMPAQPEVLKPGQLPREKIEQFFTKGYLVVEDYFTPEELDPMTPVLNQFVDNVANRLYKAGKVKDVYADLGFRERLCKLEEEFPGANILCFKQMGSVPQALKAIWANERLLNLIEQLIGPDIAGNPVWNLRTKTPRNDATTVPWHQVYNVSIVSRVLDCSYTDLESYRCLVPTAWIPFVDANEDNGCLQIMESGHMSGLVARHQCCWGGTWYNMLEEHEMRDTLEQQLQNFFVLITVSPLSLNNTSDHVRWSVDLRWQRASDPAGFYGLKGSVLMRSHDRPDLKIDWTEFDAVNRHELQDKLLADEMKSVPQDDPDFDTRVPGPWMRKWEITHVNKHVLQHRKDESAGDEHAI
ncbi:hypothetical protein MAR_034009 [Mya arenaria]|uniref:Phytanoyl-CoA dioxygenase n=1 Tax=Mya arenaria TaxID=6604 RepID=A0ABY7GDN4_MYAAR|nr:hypothetical protein MAR_034009 [Mya arenaria]